MLYAIYATMLNLNPVGSFVVNEDITSTAQRWRVWKMSFDFYMKALKLEDDMQKRNLLLHCVGVQVQEIFANLTGTGTTYQHALTALDAYFEPKINVVYERHVFRQTKQWSDESSTAYITRLRKYASTCEFADQDAEIRDQFVEKCQSNKLRRDLLQETDLTLEK